MTVKEFLWTLSPLTLRTPPFWRRSWKHRVARAMLRLFYCYLTVIIVLLWFENRMLYQAIKASQNWQAPIRWPTVEDISLATLDGTPLHAWWGAPRDWSPADGALLFAHGNGGNLSNRGHFMPALQRLLKVGVIVVDYPGYGRSGGTPSEAGCYAAGDAAFEWLTHIRGIPADQVILYGGSLGGGVATDLASRRPHRALVLVSTFTSFPDQAQAVFPWLPARWLVRNKYDNITKLASIDGPVFVTHSRTDSLIPFEMGERLYAAARGPKQFFAMTNYGHDDFPNDEGLAAMAKFLNATPPGNPK